MKKLLLFSMTVLLYFSAFSQSNIDTIAIQDFDGGLPTWNYTGSLAGTQSGFASSATSIPGTPLGISGSTAWHVSSVSSGNTVTFNNTSIPGGYDSVFISFQLSAMNLNGSGGGPDNLDYVLVEYSTDGGTTFTSRIRVRGATSNNSYWPYSASGSAVVDYLPATEVVFQPTSSGLQMTQGISFVQIGFPGSVSQIAARITPRSSSSSDSWLIDNVLLSGKLQCNNTSSSITPTTCDSYMAPSGAVINNSGTHLDTIPNSIGCDSIITINLTVNNSDATTDVVSACESYTWIDGNTYSSNNNTATYTYTNASGCDSVITLDLTILNSTSFTDVQTACNSYTWIDGNTYTTSNNSATDTIVNAAGCDSIVTLDLTILNSTSFTDVQTACDSYTWIDGNTYTTSNNTATDTLVNAAGCDSIITLDLTINAVDVTLSTTNSTLEANANQTVASYQWIDCSDNSLLSDETSQSFTATSSSEYAVIVESTDGCIDTSSCEAVIGTGIFNTNSNSSMYSVYPNPTQGEVTLEFEKELQNISITITNISGQVIQQQTLNNSRFITLQLEGSAGFYFCTISSDNNESQTIRLVKR
ncbi:T9SS type A sorting domain-containing protein [Salibacter halophilus]|uniref:T9SS type A sorting domain-containing protein n=1 Tax=Salibacter halophilus TaxID=1803916 RepID=A0A6N6M6C3_9FLAO|nr:T9SS type A sorting domain-containing protein [Salibacter halophilus]KAB1065157.1 T9SS type A sorting domain-containing protein [Salibacter halophilus]